MDTIAHAFPKYPIFILSTIPYVNYSKWNKSAVFDVFEDSGTKERGSVFL